MTDDPTRTRGRALGAAALTVATSTATAIVVPAEHPRMVLPLVGLALLLLTVAVVTRSDRLIAVATVPLLAAAVIHVQFSDEAVALWALGVGCGWYLATELGWEAIARRVACRFEPDIARRRAQDVVTVLAISCLIATVSLAASNLAPRRTVLVEALLIVMVIGGGATALRRLTTS